MIDKEKQQVPEDPRETMSEEFEEEEFEESKETAMEEETDEKPVEIEENW
jgi:hypothetical protein